MNDPQQHGDTLRHELFSAGLLPDADTVDQRTADWFRAVRTGFHETPYTDEEVARVAASYRADGRVVLGVYDVDAPAPALDAGIPVATFAEYRKSLNVGAGRLVDSHLITVVTVRPSHRRRGILRRMMTDSLERAREAGLPIAALTASEGTIYGRFGFGPATALQSVEVDTRGGLPIPAAPRGRVVAVDPASLADLAPRIFARFHATSRGSIDRQDAYLQRAIGEAGPEGPKRDPKLRAAVHLDDDGEARGYVTYSFAGWDKTPPTLRISDLVAASGTARRELWRYLGAHDLIEKIEYGAAAVNDPLPWMVDDPRRVEVKEAEDLLWLRILDVPAALRARGYNADGFVRIAVSDPMGFAGGTFGLTVEAGAAAVEPLPGGGTADIELDINVLGSLYLGGVDVRTLAAAGRIREAEAGGIERAARLLDLPGAPYGITGF